MKKILIFLASLVNFHELCAQVDPWKCVNGNGFGDNKNTACSQFFVLNNKIFTSTQRKAGNPPGQVWFSSTGDTNTWTKVTSYAPALSNSDLSIFCGGTTDTSGGMAFISTLNPTLGTAVYRSTTTSGTSWGKINNNGFGSPANYRTSPTIVVFKDSLYAATWNNNGSQIWRCHSTNTVATSWTKVIDFANVDTSIKDMTYLYIWNGTLYAGTNGNSTKGCNLYQTTNGSVWTKNTGVGDGFGTPQNNVIASLGDFNGSLYAGTLNQQGGGQLWKTANGTSWVQVTSNAFGQGTTIRELKRIAVAGGWLWVSGNPSAGNSDQIWKSSNGTNFVRSNSNGFGDANNASFPMLGVYNNYVYYGGENLITGGQIWRTCVTPSAMYVATNTTVCQGSTVNFTNSSLYANTYNWLKNGISFATTVNASATFNTPGTYSITLFANTGLCKDSLTTLITVNACTDIKQVSVIDPQIKIWPNPTNGILNIEGHSKNSEVRIIDMLGNEVRKENLYQRQQLDIGDLNNGVYFIMITNPGKQIISRKLILNK